MTPIHLFDCKKFGGVEIAASALPLIESVSKEKDKELQSHVNFASILTIFSIGYACGFFLFSAIETEGMIRVLAPCQFGVAGRTTILLGSFMFQHQVRTLFVSGLPLDTKSRELYLLFRGFKVSHDYLSFFLLPFCYPVDESFVNNKKGLKSHCLD